MNYAAIYNQISSNATFLATLFLIAIALWILAVRKIERTGRNK